MNRPVRLDDLAHHAGFARLPEGQRRRLASLGYYLNVPAGEAVMRQGDDADLLFVLLEGTVRLSTGAAPDGFTTLGPGQLLGWSTLLSAPKRVATVTALEDCRLIAIPGEPLGRLCDADPPLAVAVARAAFEAVAERLVDTRNTWAEVQEA